MLKGKYTIVALEHVYSKGFPYAWDTNILEMTEKSGIVTIIHKPNGTMKTQKNTYSKKDELKIYSGWIRSDITNTVWVSFDSLKQIKVDPVFTL